MLYKSITIAMMILVIWLLFLVSTSQQALVTLEQKLAQQHKQTAAFQVTATEQINAITEILNQQQTVKKEVEQALNALEQHKQLYALQKTYADLLQATLLHREQKFEQAVVLLKSTKDVIWQTGERKPEHKAVLQGLMQPIDAALQQWGEKKTEPSIEPVYSAVLTVLNAQDK